MVLIALAAATADALRVVLAASHLVAAQPIFPVPSHTPIGGFNLLGAALIGIVGGFAA